MKAIARHFAGRQSGQSLVEFAVYLGAFMMLMIGAVQLALIGNAALAVSQLAYAGARYAAVNPSFDSTAITSYVKSIAPTTVNENQGSDLTVSVTPATVPRSFGTQVSVSISYNLNSKLLLPNPFMGITLPTSLSNIANTMMSE